MSKHKAAEQSRILSCSLAYIVHLTMLFIVSDLIILTQGRPCDGNEDYDNQDAVYQGEREQYDKSSESIKRLQWIVDKKGRQKLASVEDVEDDVVDREDHITQYLSELLVNTEHENTMLQANDDVGQDGEFNSNQKEDRFFEFVTGDAKVLQVDGVWSYPANTALDDDEKYY